MGCEPPSALSSRVADWFRRSVIVLWVSLPTGSGDVTTRRVRVASLGLVTSAVSENLPVAHKQIGNSTQLYRFTGSVQR